jgi:large subunit ribosomal protein L22
MKAVLRQIRISPQKANLVAGMVRGKKVNEALDLLKFMPKKGAGIIYKVVNSAAFNAKNSFKQNIDDLFITSIVVTKGTTYKRSLAVSRGRNHPILKRTCNIMVEVGVDKDEIAEKPAKAEVHSGKTVEPEVKSKTKSIAKKAEEKTKKSVSKKTTVKKSENAAPKAKEKIKTEKKK